MLANDSAIDRLSANELEVNNEIARKIATPRPFMYIDFLLFEFDPPGVVPGRYMVQFGYQVCSR
jgi:hypothetical protein